MYRIGSDLPNEAFWLLFVVGKLRIKRPGMMSEL